MHEKRGDRLQGELAAINEAIQSGAEDDQLVGSFFIALLQELLPSLSVKEIFAFAGSVSPVPNFATSVLLTWKVVAVTAVR